MINNTSPSSCDLQDIIMCYQSQPDLLRLILSSKLEEDKRRAEEAKLKAKELDLLLIQQQQQMMTPTLTSSPSTTSSSTGPSVTSNDAYSTFGFHSIQQQQQQESSMDTSSSPSFNGMIQSMNNNNNNVTSPPTISSSPHHRKSSPITFTTSSSVSSSGISSLAPPSPPPSYGIRRSVTNDPTSFNLHDHPTSSDDINQPPASSPSSFLPLAEPRRRREMQAITKIVETRDYPYIDGHSWRNNGNTVQKKTGNKSVYYKCANSIKGCAVNKTLTWRGNGEYLIKYRGEHLPECGNMQHIPDV
ncbi:uncharacterized protein BX664DRAFT_365759 [Halteromyces radiatus]|uniref:uncharacterized protein n=1 Tax=Halteromyces radiatus TaxID=101107 RepID=UPI00221F898D|nr:uncharacterized protein BX664DRAFT_365759 [Halteromyces radiatus]KAI8090040.1 hypothetical protein BX664DRAFT_365759 [Halteromyces radiatus]